MGDRWKNSQGFEGSGIRNRCRCYTEFGIIGQNNREEGFKEADTHGVFQKVKDLEDSGLRVVLEQKDQEDVGIPEEEREENLVADSADDGVHLDDLEIGVVAGMDEEV